MLIYDNKKTDPMEINYKFYYLVVTDLIVLLRNN